MLLSLCLRPLPYAALHQLTFLSFSLSFLSPPFFFISLISFTWRLFTCLSHSGQSVLPPCTISSLLSLLFTLPARQSRLCFSFVLWTLFLSLDFVRWLRLTPGSDRLTASRTVSQNVFCFFSTSDDLMSYTRQSSHLFSPHLMRRSFPRKISLRCLSLFFVSCSLFKLKNLAVMNPNKPPAADQTHSRGKMFLDILKIIVNFKYYPEIYIFDC